jgi:cytochrome c-type biogenesis protein CcsB
VYSAIAVYALAMLAYAMLGAHRAARTPQPLVRIEVAAGEPSTTSSDPPPRPALPSGDGGERLAAVAASLTFLGVALNLGAVLTRGLAAGRSPWGNMYEFALVAALVIAVTYLVFLRRDPVRVFGVWITGVVVLTLGLAATVLYTPAGSLVPVLNSYWLVIHVAAAIIAGGIFTLGAIAVAVYLVQERREGRHDEEEGDDRLASVRRAPAASTLQRVAYSANLFAFPVWTFAVIAGAIWAENSWGRYWGWDPKETWAFITWVLYAAYFHAEATAGWRGRNAAWFALAGYAAFVFNFFGVNMWITGLHSYAGI